MPATRHTRDRTEKADELVAAAERLLVEQGYEATTIAAVAQEVGVATNVVYWYFPSKDHLFVAALRLMLARVLADESRRAEDLEDRIVRIVGRLVRARRLIAAVHQRAAQSDVVAEFHDETHRLYETMLSAALVDRCPSKRQRDLATESLITAMEGLLLHGAKPAKIRRTVHFLLDRLTAPTPAMSDA